MNILYTLLPASFNGISFSLQQCSIKTGRRTAVHEYPNRDTIYVEDLGQGMTAYSITGYLACNYSFAALTTLISAVNKPGPGTFIHPALGTKTASCVSFESEESFDRVGAISFRAVFLETTVLLYPTTAADAKQSLLDKINNVRATIASVLSPVLSVYGFVRSAISQVMLFKNVVQSLVGSASGIFGAVASLASPDKSTDYGYVTSKAQTYSQYTDETSALQAYQQCLHTVAVAASAIDTVNPDTITAYTVAISATFVDPASAVISLSTLAQFQSTATDIVSVAVATALRRSAIAELAVAVSNYRVDSWTDATNLIATVTPIIDTEITLAGDAGDDLSYAALKQLRATLVESLVQQGLAAPVVRYLSVAPINSSPGLVLAFRLYRDINRVQDVSQTAYHPAFTQYQNPPSST